MPDDVNRPPDEPTQAYRPYGDDEPTRIEQPIPSYVDREPSSFTQPSSYTETSTGPRHQNSIAAPLVTVALLSILLGIGIGYLLFNDSSGSSPDETTTSLPSTTTTLVTSSTAESTSTTKKATTTTEATTSTTARSTSSTTTKSTSTTSTTAAG